MANCLITQGLQLAECDLGSGGIECIYVANFSEVTSYTPERGSTADTGLITSITMGSTASFFYKIEPNDDSSTFTSGETKSTANNSIVSPQQIVIVTSGNSAAKRTYIHNLIQGKHPIIVKDNNGKFWLLGEKRGMHLISSPYTSGQNLEDGHIYTLTFEGKETEGPREVDASAVAAVISE